MKKFFFYVLMTAKIPFVFANSNSDEIEKAKNYLDAKFYDQAIDIYKQLLNESITEEQKAIIQYDIATSYALKGDLTTAIEEFDSIDLKKSISPLLKKRIFQNLALAHTLRAIEMKKSQKQSDNNIDSQPLIYHFKQAHGAIEQALKAECALQKHFQKPSCIPSRLLTKLKAEIGVLLASERYLNSQQDIENRPIGQFLFWVHNSMEMTFDNLSFLKTKSFPKSLQKKYLQLFLSAQKSKLKLWDFQESKIQDIGVLKLFQQAKNHYILVIQFAENSEWEKAEIALKEAFDAIKNLMPLVFRDQLLKNLLEEISFTYKAAIEDGRFDSETIKSLMDVYAQIDALDKKNYGKSIKKQETLEEAIKKSSKQLQESQKLYKNGKEALAKLFFEDAAEWIKNALFDLEENSADKLLSKLISQQSYSLKIAETTTSSPRGDDMETIRSLAIEAQILALETAKAYIPLVYQQQIQKFQLEGKCQSSPWSYALPLFDKGKNAAQFALSLLKANNFNSAMASQELAINTWKNAALEIKNPKQDSCTQKSTQQENNQDDSKTMDNTLQLLQTLQLDDQKPPKSIPLQQTSKPW